MPTLRRILKYTPAVVLGLLAVAWIAGMLHASPLFTTERPVRTWFLNPRRQILALYTLVLRRTWVNVRVCIGSFTKSGQQAILLGRFRLHTRPCAVVDLLLGYRSRFRSLSPLYSPSPSAPFSPSASASGITSRTRRWLPSNSPITCDGRSRRERMPAWTRTNPADVC